MGGVDGQKSLIDKLITDKELKECYKKYGLCNSCKQPNTSYSNYPYCQSCDSKRLQQNFKNWTSGNHDVDELIQKAQLEAKNTAQIVEWIEYDKFEDVEYLAKGGFGTTFKAVESNIIACSHSISFIVRYFGITKDPKTNNFMMVMDLKVSSLRQHLNNNFISLSWNENLRCLLGIALGLQDIHNKGLIHHDFHLKSCRNLSQDFGEVLASNLSGNILSDYYYNLSFITDLGLCQPANVKSSQNSNKKIYGVLPYVAPEVLRGKEYTQASDIYGFRIIAYEICTGFSPYYYIAHDEYLAMKISDKLLELINDLYPDSGIEKQIKEADEINEKSSYSTVQSPSSSTNTPQAVYTSKLLDFKNLPEPKNADNDDLEYSVSLRMDFTKLDIKDIIYSLFYFELKDYFQFYYGTFNGIKAHIYQLVFISEKIKD
ncbi:kinase-like domain-containing protein [Rhizophagus diaphanus]|nr:kinase-like domain-containing protein [Rhizophagus diaphanus] [Rhizophagus sp. MUCL 43196]